MSSRADAAAIVRSAAPVELYVRNQKRAVESCGIAFEERHSEASVTGPEVRAAIATLNADPRVTGIIIQRPVPERLKLKEL